MSAIGILPPHPKIRGRLRAKNDDARLLRDVSRQSHQRKTCVEGGFLPRLRELGDVFIYQNKLYTIFHGLPGFSDFASDIEFDLDYLSPEAHLRGVLGDAGAADAGCAWRAAQADDEEERQGACTPRGRSGYFASTAIV
jgi:hypothetical protein